MDIQIPEEFAKKAKNHWDADRKIREEFEEDFQSYLFYSFAAENGYVKSIAGRSK